MVSVLDIAFMDGKQSANRPPILKPETIKSEGLAGKIFVVADIHAFETNISEKPSTRVRVLILDTKENKLWNVFLSKTRFQAMISPLKSWGIVKDSYKSETEFKKDVIGTPVSVAIAYARNPRTNTNAEVVQIIPQKMDNLNYDHETIFKTVKDTYGLSVLSSDIRAYAESLLGAESSQPQQGHKEDPEAKQRAEAYLKEGERAPEF